MHDEPRVEFARFARETVEKMCEIRSLGESRTTRLHVSRTRHFRVRGVTRAQFYRIIIIPISDYSNYDQQ